MKRKPVFEDVWTTPNSKPIKSHFNSLQMFISRFDQLELVAGFFLYQWCAPRQAGMAAKDSMQLKDNSKVSKPGIPTGFDVMDQVMSHPKRIF